MYVIRICLLKCKGVYFSVNYFGEPWDSLQVLGFQIARRASPFRPARGPLGVLGGPETEVSITDPTEGGP